MSNNITENRLRSTNIYGTFGNYDKSDGTIQANAIFQRNVNVKGNLLLGNETTDSSGNATDSGGNIQFTLNKTIYSLPLKTLSYLINISSDVQQQISNISASSGSISNVGYITQTFGDGTSTQFGFRCYNKTSSGVNNTVFGGINMEHNTTGSYNTSIGFISMSNNTTGGGNTSLGYHALGNNTTGSSNTCIGISSGVNILTGNNNVCIGNTSGSSLINNTGSTCIGTSSDSQYNYSTALGCNSKCTSQYQIMLGSINDDVVVPNTMTITKKVTFLDYINDVSASTFSYLKNVTSDIQQQINNQINNLTNPLNLTVGQSGNDNGSFSAYVNNFYVEGTSALFNNGLTSNGISTFYNIIFNGTINSLSTFTFGYLTNLRYDVQQQFDNNTPVGSVIMYAGSASSLTGYLPCNGAYYNISQYPRLYNVIGSTYGAVRNSQFPVPNFQGIFLRGANSQFIQVSNVGVPAGKTYSSPPLGSVVFDQINYTTTNSYVDNITTTSRNFVINNPLIQSGLDTAIQTVNFTKSNTIIGDLNNTETAPVHMSIQYFIKYQL